MAFTGTATVTQISDSIVRITGVSLAASASGTIGFQANASANVKLPSAFGANAQLYTYGGATLSLIDIVSAEANSVAAPSGLTAFGISKAGTAQATFAITVLNTFGSASGGLEIYVRLHE